MKFPAHVGTVGLMSLAFMTSVMGSYKIADVGAQAAPIVQRDTTIAAYEPDTIERVLATASELLAAQIVGAADSILTLQTVCQFFPVFTSRLNSQGYDTALMQQIICDSAAGTDVPSLSEVQAVTIELSSEIWIIQAIGAVQGKSGVKKLCNLINNAAASAIGLAGDFVKQNVCGAATVAEQVASADQPEQYTITDPIVNTIAPVSTVVLPFTPTTIA
ncbi:hypothetical protein MMC07_007383 [Pseudocyphellaria aurata]|nr:hypothetical protein [Pseudocyphellaria aurata]